MVMKVSSYELFPGLSDAASKHAVQAFFDCLRAEVEEYGISVSTISHSFIHSPAPAEESPAPEEESPAPEEESPAPAKKSPTPASSRPGMHGQVWSQIGIIPREDVR